MVTTRKYVCLILCMYVCMHICILCDYTLSPTQLPIYFVLPNFHEYKYVWRCNCSLISIQYWRSAFEWPYIYSLKYDFTPIKSKFHQI